MEAQNTTTETTTQRAGATSSRPAYYLTKVVKEFDGRKEAEEYVNTHELDADDVIIRGKTVDQKTKITL